MSKLFGLCHGGSLAVFFVPFYLAAHGGSKLVASYIKRLITCTISTESKSTVITLPNSFFLPSYF